MELPAIGALDVWLTAGAGVVAIAAAVHSYIHGRSRANRKALNDLEAVVAGHEARLAALDESMAARRSEATRQASRADESAREMTALRLHLAEHYISREDWVPMTSRVIGMLEEHTAMLARLDERSRGQQERSRK